jgi:HEAT repeat protein
MKSASLLFLTSYLCLVVTCDAAPTPAEVSDAQLARLTPAELVGLFDHWSPVTREHAAIELATRGSTVIPLILPTLQDKSPRVRRSACDALAYYCGPRHPGPLRGKRDEELVAQYRREAAAAIGPLTRLLVDPDAWVRVGAADALGQFGPDAHAAAPALLKAMADQDDWVVEFASLALAKVGVNTLDRQQLYPILLRALQHPRANTRKAAVQMLDELGSPAPTAAPALLVSVRDRCPDAMFADGPRVDAARLLAKWKSPEAVKACIILLDEDRHGAAYRISKTLEILRGMGPAGKDAVPAIERMLVRKDADLKDDVRRSADQTLDAIKNGMVKPGVKAK